MLTKRLIACLNVVNGKVTDAAQDNILASAEILAHKMYEEHIDELIFCDITEQTRSVDIETVKKVARWIFIPLTVGGSIKSLSDMYKVLEAGAEKISVDLAAVRNPEIIREGAKAFGSQSIVLSTQVKRSEKMPSGYEVCISKTAIGKDAAEWLKYGQDLGAGEICLNSLDRDGTFSGYDIELMKLADAAVSVPIIASGGAGKPEHLSELFRQTESQGAIISSMLFSPRIEKNYSVRELKKFLSDNEIRVRPVK
ncbi:MAG: imidazole glycerol phosphate synthase cyclase subunit [Defluviitaleaceae bacterium]|nr:imidazole glycerol phosphate synthase cyclase subunit [Defluviitaleaceae bacterium]